MRLLYALDTLIGLLLTASAALFCSITLYNSSWKFLLPLVFVGFVLLVAYRFGRLTGVLGTVAAAAIFATCLYLPYGNLHVASLKGRESLNWMLLGGISLSFLLPHKYGLLAQRIRGR
ncbi:MAG: hypothetical protein ABI383_10065 [Acidobacteriaceae bacterium]